MKRTLILFCALFVPYAVGLVYLARVGPNDLPAWIGRTPPIYFALALVVLAVWGRPKASAESARPPAPVSRKLRRMFLVAAIVYAIALIRVITFIVRESVPFHIAASVLVVAVLMLGAFAWLYARISRNRDDDTGRNA